MRKYIGKKLVLIMVSLFILLSHAASNKRKTTEGGQGKMRKMVTNKKLKEDLLSLQDALVKMSSEGALIKAYGPQAIVLHSLKPHIDDNIKTWLLSMSQLQKNTSAGKMPLYIKLKIAFESADSGLGCLKTIQMANDIVDLEKTIAAMRESPFYANDLTFLESLSKGRTYVVDNDKIGGKDAMNLCMFCRGVLNAALLLSGLESRLLVTNRVDKVIDSIEKDGHIVVKNDPLLTLGDITKAAMDRVWNAIDYALKINISPDRRALESRADDFYGGKYRGVATADICNSLRSEKVIDGLHVLINIVVRRELEKISAANDAMSITTHHDTACDSLINMVNDELGVYERQECEKHIGA